MATIAGYWGSTDITYALGVETGDFSYLRGSNEGRGSLAGFKRPPTRRNKGNQGSLRKATDEHYPRLGKAIAGRIR